MRWRKSTTSSAYFNARGIADLRAIASLIGEHGFAFGARPTSIDAAIYGFVANVFFYSLDTPLRLEARD
jgi:hypothetical protein